MLPILQAAQTHGQTNVEAIAVRDRTGQYTYAQLLARARRVAGFVQQQADVNDLKEERVAFLTAPDAGYLATLWGTWLAGGVTVPLCPSHPELELQYFIENSEAEFLIADRKHFEKLQAAAGSLTVFCLEEILESECGFSDINVDLDRRANVLYTSGTTHRPKGVVTTHRQVTGQIETLVTAWRWSKDDRTLNILPLHHTHGLINVVSCALYSGAQLEMHEGFDTRAVWNSICQNKPNVFMAVPTIYSKLIQHFEAQREAEQKRFSQACRSMRLMVSGSAALPVPVFERWFEISGHRLLERYGMTEIGMALSNPYEGERLPGTVGQPLPGMEIRLDETGQILVRGPNIFKEYWNNPQATNSAFRDGWFRTGDIASLENGYYRILGRDNIDIIKSGGYKISALEIESVLKAHPQVLDAAVVGLPDPEWGERIGACLVLREDFSFSLDELRAWASERLAKYKLPTRWICVPDLPKNAMGKVTKNDVRHMMEGNA